MIPVTQEQDDITDKQTVGYRIRHYRDEDYARMVEIWEEAGRKPFTKRCLARILAAEGGVLVAETDQEEPQTVGVLLWSHNGRVAHIWRLAVCVEHRGHGVASQLLRFAECEIAEAGFESLGLLVLSSNVAAKALYRKNGWQHNEGVEYWGKRVHLEESGHPTCED